jgi:class 3 adenylate cyclase
VPARVTCPSCGAANEAGRKFCGECGTRLSATCPSCGTPNAPGTKFCGECGTRLTDAAPAGAVSAADPGASAATTPATERRLVSVLFADLVGFTTLSEGRDAEDVRELLDGYFATCREIVDRYGGTIEKFIGDAVMAVWGTPVAQEDDAERAVRAALDLVDAVRQLGAGSDVPDLALRAGVQSGEAVVTIGATGMGMVAGDLVNTAARLQSVAAPGTVIVGEGTRRAADTAIVFEAAGEQELKGKAVPVAAFRALRVVAQRGGVGRSEGLEPPFVGRDAELRLIKDFYHATAREQGPRLVSVIGQAGIGKSRLAWEFLKYIDGVTEIVHWHQGRSPAYGEGISFWALGEMVRMRIGIGEGTDEAATREALARSLEEYVPDADERRSLTDPLLHLLGIGDSGGRERGQLFVAWRTFFERIAEQGPVVMVFEDLQWADDGLLDFVEELVTWSRGRSIYVITLARSELLDRRPTWGAGQRSFTSLNLSPLSDEDMRTLLDGLVPGLPPATRDEIVGRAEGIPLYAVETVRMLLNDGRIERDGDRFRLVGTVEALDVPASLQALIAARIDALPAPERTLVQDASVLGLSFSLPAVQAVSRSAAELVEPMLGHLLQRELLTVDVDPRSPERGQYRFVQGLLREVAYGTLSRDDRRSRHLAAARYYETLGDDELSGVLAQHYVDAYQAHPDGPEGAALGAQARVALRGAAQRASELGSNRLAHGYLGTALSVTTEPAEELELQEQAADAAVRAGMMDVAARHAERAVTLAGELGLEERRRRAVAGLADTLLEGHQQRAHELLTGVLAEPGFGPSSPGYGHVASILAKAEMRMLNDARAIELADLALPVASEHESDEIIIDLLVTRGVSLSNIGRMVEALTILSGARHVANRANLPAVAGRAAINLSYALANDDPAGAFDVARDAMLEAVEAGHIIAIRYLLGNAAAAALEIGEWDWAVERLDEYAGILVEPGDALWVEQMRAYFAACRGEDVAELAAQLYEESRTVDDPQYRVIGAEVLLLHRLLAGDWDGVMEIASEMRVNGIAGAASAFYGVLAALRAGDAAAARRFLEIHADAQPGTLKDILAAMGQGGLAMLEARPDDARTQYATARRLARDHGFRFWLAQVDLDIVRYGAMTDTERRQAADEAREIFTGVRATVLLDDLDAVVGGPRRSGARPGPVPVRDRAAVTTEEDLLPSG